MRMIKHTLLALALAALAACGGLPSKIDPPSVSLSGLRIVDMNLLEQTFAIKLRVKNPNDFDIPIHGLTYALELNGQEVAQGVNNQSVTFPALGEEFVEVNATTNLPTILNQLVEMSRSGMNASYRVHGSFRAGKGVQGYVPIPFDQKGEVGLGGLMDLGKQKPAPGKEYL
ncbi:MAG: LEA type 2 family protein [Gammaproteobacteria bacterium]